MKTQLHPKYRTDIDGLRAFAVLSVVLFHTFPHLLPGGFIGVDVFFVISGFLISTIILSNLDRGRFSYRDFYARRIRRIFPSLFVVLAASMGFSWFFLLASEFKQLSEHVLGGAGFISNLLLWRESGYFDAGAETKPLLHLWSLGIEEQFYIFWPLLLGLAWRFWRSAIAVIVGVALISFTVNIATISFDPTAAFYSPFSRFWELVAGGLVAHVMMQWTPSSARLQNSLSIAGVFLLLCGLALVNKARAFPGWWALMPTLGVALAILAGPNALLNRNILSNRVAVWFGKISYPLYLWHWPILSFAVILNNYSTPTRGIRTGLALLAIALAWLTFKVIEQPIRFKAKGSTFQLFGFASFVAVLAATTIALGGLPARPINQDEARVLINRYATFRQVGLSTFYEEKCDFYDWKYGGRKVTDPSCTIVDIQKPVFFLWGDSHAQALAFGMRKNLSDKVQLARIMTSGCKPKLHDDDTRNGASFPACKASNEAALQFIREKNPVRVFATQAYEYDKTDWLEIAKFVEANQGKLVLLGPVPHWLPSLPLIVANSVKAPRKRISEGLDPEVFSVDSSLKKKYSGTAVRYISILDAVCTHEGCLSTVPSDNAINLFAIDYGHLTPAASDFVAKTALHIVLQPPAP